jgi:hypothetical protein
MDYENHPKDIYGNEHQEDIPPRKSSVADLAESVAYVRGAFEALSALRMSSAQHC